MGGPLGEQQPLSLSWGTRSWGSISGNLNPLNGAGAQIVLNHTYNTYDSEPAWGQCAQFVPVFSATVQNWLPAGDITPLDNTTLRLNGVHSHLTTIVDTVINETGAPARMPLGIHCLVT